MAQLWRDCCLMLQNTNILVFKHVKLPEIEYKSLVCSSAFALICLCESGLSFLLHLKTKYWKRLNPSNDLRVALCDNM